MIGNINSNYYSSLYGLSSLNRTNSINSYQSIYNALGTSSLYGRNTFGSVDYASVNAIKGLKEDSSKLQSMLHDVQNGSAFKTKTAISSNTDAMTVSSTNGKSIPKMQVEISQVATGQQNQGDALAAKGPAQAGEYVVQVEVGGKTSLVNFRVNEGDTNAQMQQKMADAINAKDIGVKASVSTKNGESTLTVESRETGANSKGDFAIRDYVGNAVRTTGTGEATQEAQDAIYSVNGVEKRSSTNKVDLGNGVTATLKQATDEAVSVTTGTDPKTDVTAVKELVTQYNELLHNADANSRLSRELSSITKAYSSTLNRMGINVGEDGSLSVNDSKLNAAAESGRVQEFFTQDNGRSYGFSNQLNRVAGNVNRSTLNYANTAFSPAGMLQSGGGFYNALLSANQANSMGMFFNLMI